jgi:group II intron reverse transcriptase/maturase
VQRVGSGQLTFAFAGRPKGDRYSNIKDWLWRIANDKWNKNPTAEADPQNARMLEKVASMPNLAQALLNVERNKGSAGVDGRSVEEVVLNTRSLMPKLRHELLTGKYRPGEIRRVWIPKPGGGQRGLGIPNVVDRWVQQAFVQAMEPVFEKVFHTNSHGFRTGRSPHTAIKQAKKYVEEGFRKVVDIDISKFFDRVNHQRLLNRLGQNIKDQRILQNINRMLKAKVVLPDGTKIAVEEGTPQGGPLSPLLSNVVLDELDWELDKRGLRFVRYADDCNIYVRSRRAGMRVMSSITRFIERRLRLQVNAEKSSVTVPQKSDFLGFSILVNSATPIEIRLSEKSKKKVNARVKEMTPRTWGRSIRTCMKELSSYFTGWEAYFNIVEGKGINFFQKVDSHTRRRLRAIIVKQKKRKRFLFRSLVKRGISEKMAAWTAFSQRGYWSKSWMRGMHVAFSNVWFYGKLVSLEGLWQDRHPKPLTVLNGQLLLAF